MLPVANSPPLLDPPWSYGRVSPPALYSGTVAVLWWAACQSSVHSRILNEDPEMALSSHGMLQLPLTRLHPSAPSYSL